jgi:hypothetical protein
VGLDDEKKFVHFVFEEFLRAKGDGFDGHVLTIGHALLDTFSDYDIWLCKVGGELNAPWEGFRATQAALDFVVVMRAKPEVAKQWWEGKAPKLKEELQERVFRGWPDRAAGDRSSSPSSWPRAPP